MRYLISPDSFKGSISSAEACEAISLGIRKADKNAVIHIRPMADGGEGTLEALTKKEERVRVLTKSSLGKKHYGYIGITKDYAIVEMAQAVALDGVKEEERNPEMSTTCGVGMLIEKAIKLGYKRILLCVGGSGTNDGGAGMMQCLGAKFFDWSGKEIMDIRAGDLISIRDADFSRAYEKLKDISITVASDVTNPLLGDNGASRIYGPQKGADHDMVERLEKGLSNYADVLEKKYGKSVRDFPGTGAGGGICYPLVLLDKAKILSGAEAVISHQKTDELLDESDVLITGEGSVDSQSKSGKTLDVLCSLAQKKNVPVVVFAGVCEDKDSILSEYKCIRSIRTLSEIAKNKEDSKKNAKRYLEKISCTEFLDDRI